MKRLFCLIMSIIMMLSLSLCVYATEISVQELESITVVAEKKKLREAHYNEDIVSALHEKGVSVQDRNLMVDALMKSLLTVEMTQAEQAKILSDLEGLGIYALESSLEDFNSVQTRSSPTYLSWRSVIITYDSYNDSWILGAGGNWTTNNWYDDIPRIDGWETPYVGEVINIGGLDGVGIRLFNTFGTYYPTELIDSYLYVTDGQGASMTSRTREAGISASNGVFFPFQDYVTCTEAYIGSDLLIYSNWKYMGNNFAIIATYSSDFQDYHGYAEIQYVHTWNQTTINSVTANVSLEPGFQVAFSSNNNKFSVTSNSETVF